MDYLSKPLRRALESTVVQARDVAEGAAQAVLKHLGVGESKAPGHLSEKQQSLRRRLRAHGRQLGDHRRPDGKQSIDHLVQESAYEHWHRMLFARFLAENHLLMHPDGVALTLEECQELASDEGAANGWELAGRYASRMLPQIFRPDSPVLTLHLAPENQRQLERLLAGLDPETFHASDSLGWVYQFWQSKKKDEVNRSEIKIGADELPAVTQLFTEPYMVSFLLDNSLGAWWAARNLSEADLNNATSEDELRCKAAIPGVTLEYLRFVKLEDGTWTPAAGTFDAWPEQLRDLKTLDPCCGSGHFLVAAFLMLVPMRMARDGLSAQEAVDAVLCENLHGLELDQRCVELAAFALAFTAWKYPDANGYRALPELNVACSGLSVSVAKEEWKELGLGKKNLTIALDWMHDTFKDAPVLGSLLNPAKTDAAKLVQWDELSSALGQALNQEQSDDQQEAAVAAQGLAKAATLLAGRYHWVITNVPYLARGKQSERLSGFCERYYTAAKNDLATVFLERCLELCVEGGTSSIVLPQNWLFLATYKKFREKLLNSEIWHLITRLGPGAFDTISGEVVKAILITLSRGKVTGQRSSLFVEFPISNIIRGIDVSGLRTTAEKSEALLTSEIKSVSQARQLENPDAIVSLDKLSSSSLLKDYVNYSNGIQAGDSACFVNNFWESFDRSVWAPLQVPVNQSNFFGGLTSVLRWESGNGMFWDYVTERLGEGGQKAWVRGTEYHGHSGIAISATGRINAVIYAGSFWNDSVLVLTPNNEKHMLPVHLYCTSPKFESEVRKVDQKLNVRSAVTKVPFDLDHWTEVACAKYPNGLPKPYSDDPTQWIYHGHPCGSVVWDEDNKRTYHGSLRTDDTVLQVAVVRLLGFRWPAELDADMELADEQRERVNRCQDLAGHIDDDGIVCIPTIRGEKPASERLLSLLQAAYGDEWSAQTLNQLLAASGSKGKGLDWWLREKFFEQHCKLFQHRPFIWHIWDGLKDGFGALVNYHKLDRKTVEMLIYTYLGDWIGLQERAVNDGADGAQLRLIAAQDLKRRLELILEGEKPYDIFVRWKPLEQQPIGWNPDFNDGVRINIRPFVTAEVLRHNKKPKLNIHWNKDRGKDVESAPWYRLGLEYGCKEGDRINEHHLSLEEKREGVGS